MLKFKQFVAIFEELILEGRIDFLKNQYKDQLSTDHDKLAQHQKSDDIIDHFANNADPTKNKTHTQWILNRYREGSIRQEDHPRIREALSNFEKHKAKLPNKDIGQYKSLSHIEDAVQPHLDTPVSKRQETKVVKSEGAPVIHSENGVKIHDLKTKEAACEYGKGTRWCTAASRNNMFDEYKSRGPLYFIHARDHEGSGRMRKYQFHPHSGQLMDEEDRKVERSELTKHNPEILNSPIKIHFKEHYDSPDKISKLISDDPSSPAITAAAESQHFNASHISKLISAGSSSNIRKAISHPSATTEHIGQALSHSDAEVRAAAARHPSATHDHITKALRDEDSRVRTASMKNPNVTAEHITKALDDPSWDVRHDAISHPKVTAEHITKALDDHHAYVRSAAIDHPKVTAEHITKALDDRDSDVRLTALKHPKATAEHITKALDDHHVDVRSAAIRQPEVNTQHITQALDDTDASVRLRAIKHPLVTKSHISKALNDSDLGVRKKAAERLKQQQKT